MKFTIVATNNKTDEKIIEVNGYDQITQDLNNVFRAIYGISGEKFDDFGDLIACFKRAKNVKAVSPNGEVKQTIIYQGKLHDKDDKLIQVTITMHFSGQPHIITGEDQAKAYFKED